MKLFLLFTLLFFCLPGYSQKISELKTAADPMYGYSYEKPLQVKQGNPGKSYDFFLTFMENLVTEDGQELVLLNHFSVLQADKKKPNPLIRDYQRGVFKKSSHGVYGMVERYQFLTQSSKDTITLFVDLNRKGNLKIPYRLKIKTS